MRRAVAIIMFVILLGVAFWMMGAVLSTHAPPECSHPQYDTMDCQ